MRPRAGTGVNDRLWICIFAFPNGSFDVGDRVEFGSCLVERGFELAVFLEGGLDLLRAAIVALRRSRGGGALQAGGLGVEDQPLLDFLQVNQGEDTLLGQQRVAGREQFAQQLLRSLGVARRMARRREGQAQHETVGRRRRRLRGGRDAAENVGLLDGIALDEAAQRLQIDGDSVAQARHGRGCFYVRRRPFHVGGTHRGAAGQRSAQHDGGGATH
jgi:hypothetical protein